MTIPENPGSFGIFVFLPAASTKTKNFLDLQQQTVE